MCGKTDMAKLRGTVGTCLKMAGATYLLLLYAFMDWTGTAIPVSFM
jgi:hypothetical protein